MITLIVVIKDSFEVTIKSIKALPLAEQANYS